VEGGTILQRRGGAHKSARGPRGGYESHDPLGALRSMKRMLLMSPVRPPPFTSALTAPR
jgi:hypothetical protein